MSDKDEAMKNILMAMYISDNLTKAKHMDMAFIIGQQVSFTMVNGSAVFGKAKDYGKVFRRECYTSEIGKLINLME